jgi:hypothetical protein
MLRLGIFDRMRSCARDTERSHSDENCCYQVTADGEILEIRLHDQKKPESHVEHVSSHPESISPRPQAANPLDVVI